MESALSRRGLLRGLGAAAVATTAGCVGRDDGGSDRRPGTTRAATQELPEAEGSEYTEVYRDAIDSVATLDVYGARRGQGSAFVFEDDYLVTNHHVVDGADTIDVQYTDNDWTGAEVVGTDPHTDLGVVEVDDRPEYAAPLPLAETEPVVGQRVMALGNPLGLDASVSTGVVSGTNRSIPTPVRENDYQIPNAIQTDAPLNPGNSGGPLVNVDGRAIGVANAGGGDNLGFGISAAVMRRVLPSLIEDGTVAHSRIGIGTRPVDRRVAQANDLEAVRGVYVVSVTDGGPADGVLEGRSRREVLDGRPVPVGGDVVVAVDDTPIPTSNELSTYLTLETRPGDRVTITVVREGSERDVELTLDERSV